jgi:hypothetical protein
MKYRWILKRPILEWGRGLHTKKKGFNLEPTQDKIYQSNTSSHHRKRNNTCMPSLWDRAVTITRTFPVGMSITVKTRVSFRHLLRHRSSASARVDSTLKSVCFSVKTTFLSVKTTLRLSYRLLEMTLLSVSIKSHSKLSKRHSKCHFQHSII